MKPAAQPGVPVLRPVLRTKDGRGRTVAQLHELEEHRPEQAVWLVQQSLVDHEQAVPAELPEQYLSWCGFDSGSSAYRRHLQSIAPRREKREAAPKDGSPVPHAAED